jgi:hypothetical protein
MILLNYLLLLSISQETFLPVELLSSVLHVHIHEFRMIYFFNYASFHTVGNAEPSRPHLSKRRAFTFLCLILYICENFFHPLSQYFSLFILNLPYNNEDILCCHYKCNIKLMFSKANIEFLSFWLMTYLQRINTPEITEGH